MGLSMLKALRLQRLILYNNARSPVKEAALLRGCTSVAPSDVNSAAKTSSSPEKVLAIILKDEFFKTSEVFDENLLNDAVDNYSFYFIAAIGIRHESISRNSFGNEYIGLFAQ